MNPLHRNAKLLESVIGRGCVAIDPALTREAQFGRWLDTVTASCGRHQQTRLVLDRTASQKRTLSRSDGDIWFDWSTGPPEKLGAFHCFEAVFRCPACKLQYAQVPPEFWESSFDSFRTNTAELAGNLVKCTEFATQVNKRGCGFLLMAGFSGNGKTRLACNIVRELNSDDAIYTRQGGLTDEFRAAYGRKDVYLHHPRRRGEEFDNDRPPALLDIVQKVCCLVLDEIGCNPLANDERLFLDELLKHRYEHRNPTILVSNLPLVGTPEEPGLKEFLGDALCDRINHATGNGRFILQFSGESYRRGSGETYLEGLG